jgi:hypothetical protein
VILNPLVVNEDAVLEARKLFEKGLNVPPPQAFLLIAHLKDVVQLLVCHISIIVLIDVLDYTEDLVKLIVARDHLNEF